MAVFKLSIFTNGSKTFPLRGRWIGEAMTDEVEPKSEVIRKGGKSHAQICIYKGRKQADGRAAAF